MLPRVLFVLATCLAAWPAPASAQIYAWRDARGTLVLSDRIIETPTEVHVVDGAPGYRTTRPPGTSPAGSGTAALYTVAPYDELVREHAARQALRPELVRAVIQVESGFNPRARSSRGAMGLMQLMPATARELGVRDAYDPADNVRGGTAYLRQLLDRYDGDEMLALAAYNAGTGTVARYGARIPPYRETREYLRRVGAAAGAATVDAAGIRRQVIYKSIEVVDGRAIPRYSSERPLTGTFDVLGR